MKGGAPPPFLSSAILLRRSRLLFQSGYCHAGGFGAVSVAISVARLSPLKFDCPRLLFPARCTGPYTPRTKDSHEHRIPRPAIDRADQAADSHPGRRNRPASRRPDITPQEFYAEMLLGWFRRWPQWAAWSGRWGTRGGSALQYQVNLQQTRLPERDEEEQAPARPVAPEGPCQRRGAARPPHTGRVTSKRANPTDFLVVLGPLKTDLEVIGVVEIFQRADTGAAIAAGLSAVRRADVRPGRRLSQEPPAAAVSPTARSSGRNWRSSPARSTPASTRGRPPTRSPTKAGG